MHVQTQFTSPVIVDRASSVIERLEPLALEPADSGRYNEQWLRDLLYAHTDLIPIDEIEPIFSGTVAVCRELPTGVGPLDLVFVNEQGLLTLVECKLWRNPEARRKVVGQILDYAQEISRWTYEQLDAAIARSETKSGPTLWEIARRAFQLKDESLFIDRVSRHLRTGSFLVLIVGDGIRENTENIAAFLQKYAGLSFAFGLVEERLFAVPGSERILVQPRILAKTVEIGRLFVRADVGIAVEAERPRDTASSEIAQTKGRTLTETIFLEEIVGTSALAEDVRRLFRRLKDEGFKIEATARGKSLKIMPEGMKMNLLTLYPSGEA